MFINTVETARNIRVSFEATPLQGGNRISLLTGPNGSGKTDVLATIADIFHGAIQNTAGARVTWSNGKSVQLAESLYPSMNRERIRVVAQTFSPFSRFPGIELNPPRGNIPLYARGHSYEEAYACIGFTQHSHVKLSTLALSIVENGILGMSQRPKAARVALDLLHELEFKNGISLNYLADARLSSLFNITDIPDGIEKVFEQVLRNGHFVVAGEYITRNKRDALRDELRTRHIIDTAEYVRGSIKLIEPYLDFRHHEYIDEIQQAPKEFTFQAFRGKDGMSSDYPVLQAFSFLRRLNLLTLKRCVLRPYVGSPVDLTNTSSGQQQMLCSIFGLAAALEDEAIVLIDEPELSLHPRWQMAFFKHLETALYSAKNCHVIIATHSPLIAQAGATHGAEIIHMGGEPLEKVSRIADQHVGVSVEELLLDVFDTPIPNSLHISNEIFTLVAKAEQGNYIDRLNALSKLHDYLQLYRRDGEGQADTVNLLEKAINLISSSTAEPRWS